MDHLNTPDMTTYEGWSLTAQWVGSGAAVAAVLVAVLFGYLTLASNRRSKDAQQRATIVAALDDPNRPQSVLGRHESRAADFTVRNSAGERWLLVNEGPDIAYLVEVEGLTDLDKRRLQVVAQDPTSLGSGQTKEFVLVSRFTLSGPANVVVSYRLEPGGSQLRRVLHVPAP